MNNVVKCIECGFDLSLLFEFDKWNKPKYMVRSCPDCNTVNKLNGTRKHNEPFKVEPISTKKAVRTYTPNREYKVVTNIGKATPEEMANLGRAQCMQCNQVVDIFLSYLVRLSTLVFPKLRSTGTTITSNGSEVNTFTTIALPPVKKTGRLCKWCFDMIPATDFIPNAYGNIEVEVLKDPHNTMRDGIKNVAVSPSMKASKYEASIIEKPYVPKGKVYDELVLGFGCTEPLVELAFRPAPKSDPSNPQPSMVDKPPKLKPYKFRPQTIQLHPSRRVKKANIPSYKDVEFTSRDRRQAFKRWFEHG